MQHAAIFEKKSVHFEDGSLDHVRFYANENGKNKDDEEEERYSKVLLENVERDRLMKRFLDYPEKCLVPTVDRDLLMVLP